MIYRNMVDFYMIPKSYVSLPEGNKGAIPTILGIQRGFLNISNVATDTSHQF